MMAWTMNLGSETLAQDVRAVVHTVDDAYWMASARIGAGDTAACLERLLLASSVEYRSEATVVPSPTKAAESCLTTFSDGH